jgi:hypothetical protein
MNEVEAAELVRRTLEWVARQSSLSAIKPKVARTANELVMSDNFSDARFRIVVQELPS